MCIGGNYLPLKHQELLADAGQKPGGHRPFAFDVDGTTRFKAESRRQGVMHGFAALDAIGHSLALHGAGDVDRVPPQVIDEFVPAVHPGDRL